MITVPGLQKKGLFNHDADSKGQAHIRNSELLNKLKTVALEANPGDIVLLSKHTVIAHYQIFQITLELVWI